MKENDTCYKCEERHYLCHSTCERHKRRNARVRAEKAAIKAAKENERRITETAVMLKENAKRRQRHGSD